MLDQIVTPEVARQLHAEALRTRGMAVWIVMEDQPAYPGKLIARLATMDPTPYVMVADTLDEMRATLPPGCTIRIALLPTQSAWWSSGRHEPSAIGLHRT